ncbi:ABC transporter ATP-binding protein [Desertimonas flava]|uniref:ABC transporter ATP-binding protein n=1 Tax=Desertimonas flava TaxID=2064846 RepID=UPI001D0C1CD9|nr:ABC transporter ATP-binding protein [Desertimonas flava]
MLSTSSEQIRNNVTQTSSLLEIDDLCIGIAGTQLLAGVSFSVGTGEIVGLVGESGSGKTLTGLSVLGLLPDKASTVGSIRLNGMELLGADPRQLRQVRGSRVSMIFQEPRASLHPSRPIGKQLVDVLRAHRDISKPAARRRAEDLLGAVGLPNPRRALSSYTFELSGGMCQRVMIAMALICEPELLIADEPTTALDVTIQAQIVALLRRMADELGISVLLISHNLGLVSEVCSRIVTMYCGQVVDDDSVDGLLRRPHHPYPWALLKASTIDVGGLDEHEGIGGSPANPARPPAGCRFSPRCPHAEPACGDDIPMTVTIDGSRTRCRRDGELELGGVLS